ncbi:glutathione S-transferase family protein [Oleisolibacter albus]|uniref:glutathione S-transferase family protein n=1 Tax=Oleisolibacter albus TaxID=2171757 RepID=UPI000DF1234F|nr:glutathione S-transferase N-terminal domain-containing protein [Oleisolibacter albus]
MITLYSFSTPHGHRASILLEELGLPYKVQRVDYHDGRVHDPDFARISPLGKFPALVDTRDGQERALFGSGAILTCLAAENGKLLPADPAEQAGFQCWFNLVLTDLTPATSGQFRFHVLAPERLPYAMDYFAGEVERCLLALDGRLGQCPWLGGHAYTIADIAAFPFIDAIAKGGGLAGRLPELNRWYGEVGARPAVRRGMAVPG